jgi:hypothetical protein
MSKLVLKKPVIKKPKTHLVSMRIPDVLYQKLEAKSIELEADNISETARFLLESVLEHPPIDRALQYSILSHFIIQESVLSLVDDGEKLLTRAEDQAKKIIEQLKNREVVSE